MGRDAGSTAQGVAWPPRFLMERAILPRLADLVLSGCFVAAVISSVPGGGDSPQPWIRPVDTTSNTIAATQGLFARAFGMIMMRNLQIRSGTRSRRPPAPQR